jgi:hypothetical protein
MLIEKVRAPDLFHPKKSNLVQRYAKAMEDTQGVDPTIIADQLGLQVRTVCRIQRKLGLRKCKAVNPPRQT